MTTSDIKRPNAVQRIEDERLHAGIAAMMQMAGVIRDINVSFETSLQEKINRVWPPVQVNTGAVETAQVVSIAERKYAVK